MYRIQITQTGVELPILDVTVDSFRRGKEFAGVEGGLAVYEHAVKFKTTETERAETLAALERARLAGERLACADVLAAIGTGRPTVIPVEPGRCAMDAVLGDLGTGRPVGFKLGSRVEVK